MFCVKISCLFWGGWQLLATLRWQLANMEPVCTRNFSPLAKTNPFQVWCYKPFPGLANIEPIYGPKALNRFCSYTPGRKSRQKNQKNARSSSYQNSFENYVKILHFLAPQRGGPHKNMFCVKISCLFWGGLAASGYIEVAAY